MKSGIIVSWKFKESILLVDLWIFVAYRQQAVCVVESKRICKQLRNCRGVMLGQYQQAAPVAT
jgi:hypothetical protein